MIAKQLTVLTNHVASGTRKKGDVVNKTNVHGEDAGGKVAYGLRFDNLEYRTEVDATLTKDESTLV